MNHNIVIQNALNEHIQHATFGWNSVEDVLNIYSWTINYYLSAHEHWMKTDFIECTYNHL